MIFSLIFVKIMSSIKMVQPLYEDGPDHQEKAGTPSMGGISFLLVSIFYSIAYVGDQITTGFVIVLTLFALIGLIDDVMKITKKNNEFGLSPKQKLFLQTLFGLITLYYMNVVSPELFDSVNFFGLKLSIGQGLPFIIYIIFLLFLFVGISNATNLTDGLDGLLTSNMIITLASLFFVTTTKQIYGATELVVIIMICLMGFFFINKNPSLIFMGDVGSLSLGALIVYFSIILDCEVFLLFFGFVYFLETLSVILQVTYFKYTKKKTGTGKRLLLMAPLHHHIEKKGKSEKEVVKLFNKVQIGICILGLVIYFV
ncbi:MAG: phospho-N-acetylmuramoyl-pentapeptide-transferase [Mycoplasmatales bacterium]